MFLRQLKTRIAEHKNNFNKTKSPSVITEHGTLHSHNFN